MLYRKRMTRTVIGDYNFEVYDRRTAPIPKTPQITLQRGGGISINQTAFLAMNSPEFVELLCDREKGVIAFRNVENQPHAYPVRPVGAGGKTVLVNGRTFLEYYGIEIPVSVRFVPKLVPQPDGSAVLIIDLNGPKQEAVSNRARAVERAARNGQERGSGSANEPPSHEAG